MECNPLANFILIGQTSILTTTTLDVWCRTDVARHLYLEISMEPPSDTPFWHYKRGTAVLHDAKYSWHPFVTYEQSEPGDTLTHTWVIPGLFECNNVWWTFTGKKDLVWACSSTPFFKRHIKYAVLPPGPQPTATPIEIDFWSPLVNACIRLTWWADNTWYVVLADGGTISVWKLVDDTFERQNIGNEPTPGDGSFQSVDSRLDSAEVNIMIAAYCKDYDGPDDHVRYGVFSTATDTWGLFESVVVTDPGGFAQFDTCLALDAANKPHVGYTSRLGAMLSIYYTNKVGAGWSAPEVAIQQANRAWEGPSCWIDTTNDAFHIFARNNRSRTKYNRRAAGGGWDGETELPIRTGSGKASSLTTDLLIPHASPMPDTLRVSHFDGQPPVVDDIDLTLFPSTQAAIVSKHVGSPDLLIVFRDKNLNPAFIYKPFGFAWAPENNLDTVGVSHVSANLSADTVVSTVWRRGAAFRTRFYAFAFP